MGSPTIPAKVYVIISFEMGYLDTLAVFASRDDAEAELAKQLAASPGRGLDCGIDLEEHEVR